MDWTADTHILRRIVALLFTLAWIADRAAVARRPERIRMLGFLYQAEARAHGFILDMASGRPTPRLDAGGSFDYGDDPDGAAWLALRLRALALTLVCLLPGRLAGSQDRWPMHALRRLFPTIANALSLTPLEPLWPDTS